MSMQGDHHTSPDDLDRRRFLKGSALLSTSMFIVGTALIHPGEGWAVEATGLKPATMQTLIKMARDIYPHDQIADKYYAIAVKGYDQKATQSSDIKTLIEKGVAQVDQIAKERHNRVYTAIIDESPRVEILHVVEGGPLFTMLRAGLIVDLYNQKELWPLFGYEGESASKGGYIRRGFNDLAWL
ncbi:Twin-arginine translocation pathway signal [Beijerinckia mobilis]|uniref:Twin-arginine translocation pathway signal n=1 Tax=Beijerinckia mobilis TaxID=231434 RepID=UPI001FD9E1E1|nr:Twin-arginine translocation pathway signal [Beijerinckia mobilis]